MTKAHGEDKQTLPLKKAGHVLPKYDRCKSKVSALLSTVDKSYFKSTMRCKGLERAIST